MAVATGGWLLNNLSLSYKYVTSYNFLSISFLQSRNYAARKGTREKARKKKVKVVIEKVGFIPHNLRAAKDVAKKKKILSLEDIAENDSKKSEAVDNVWIINQHKWKVYSFEEAVQVHREMHHPTMHNSPNAFIKAFIELDMQGVKKTKFVETFSKIACIPNKFEHGQVRKILAFCKSPEMQDLARDTGAHLCGGKELIKQAQQGVFSVKEYDIIISEPSLLPDLLLIRGILKRKFPSTKLGTLGNDINALVMKFLNGVKYTVKPHDLLKSYGTTDVIFGTLNMDVKQLEENLAAVITDINDAKPHRPGPFITRVRLMSLPLPEMCKIEFEQYLSTDKIAVKEEEEEEEEEKREKEDTQEAVIASH
ncbi:39S ribosomal protein L1, mitochondrial isoform X2 [Harpegnathos saltator]|uniref:39S ribosomal protein L1, mitochondrial isoform X2 n=1 Tax=Harpegnathos saltator TaxID=610380 RepID=UPI00058CA8A1|nr:39S ribosomal protein L1, mitochondrial isoform X2 [Harpegnathos saltator]